MIPEIEPIMVSISNIQNLKVVGLNNFHLTYLFLGEINRNKRRREEDGHKHEEGQAGKIWKRIAIRTPIPSHPFGWGLLGGS